MGFRFWGCILGCGMLIFECLYGLGFLFLRLWNDVFNCGLKNKLRVCFKIGLILCFDFDLGF